MAKLNIDVSGAAKGMAGALGVVKSDLKRAVPPALNRTAARMKTLATRAAADEYPLSTRKFGQYIYLGKAGKGQMHATIELKVRAIPLEEFPTRVEMVEVEVRAWRGKAQRKLPVVTVQRFRGGKYESPTGNAPTKAFPLHQRRKGKLRKGEKVRRRTSKARNKLTKIRYYTFPTRFLEKKLLPEIRKEIPPRFHIELRAAFRSLSGRLKRNEI